MMFHDASMLQRHLSPWHFVCPYTRRPRTQRWHNSCWSGTGLRPHGKDVFHPMLPTPRNKSFIKALFNENGGPLKKAGYFVGDIGWGILSQIPMMYRLLEKKGPTLLMVQKSCASRILIGYGSDHEKSSNCCRENSNL